MSAARAGREQWLVEAAGGDGAPVPPAPQQQQPPLTSPLPPAVPRKHRAARTVPVGKEPRPPLDYCSCESSATSLSSGSEALDEECDGTTGATLYIDGRPVPCTKVTCAEDLLAEGEVGSPLHSDTSPAFLPPGKSGDLLVIRRDCALTTFTHHVLPRFVRGGELRFTTQAPLLEVVVAVHPDNPPFLPPPFRRCILPGSYSRVLSSSAVSPLPAAGQCFFRLYYASFEKLGAHSVKLADPTGAGGNFFTVFTKEGGPTLKVKSLSDEYCTGCDEPQGTIPAWIRQFVPEDLRNKLPPQAPSPNTVLPSPTATSGTSSDDCSLQDHTPLRISVLV